jgi:hypothetical protein
VRGRTEIETEKEKKKKKKGIKEDSEQSRREQDMKTMRYYYGRTRKKIEERRKHDIAN